MFGLSKRDKMKKHYKQILLNDRSVHNMPKVSTDIELICDFCGNTVLNSASAIVGNIDFLNTASPYEISVLGYLARNIGMAASAGFSLNFYDTSDVILNTSSQFWLIACAENKRLNEDELLSYVLKIEDILVDHYGVENITETFGDFFNMCINDLAKGEFEGHKRITKLIQTVDGYCSQIKPSNDTSVSIWAIK